MSFHLPSVSGTVVNASNEAESRRRRVFKILNSSLFLAACALAKTAALQSKMTCKQRGHANMKKIYSLCKIIDYSAHQKKKKKGFRRGLWLNVMRRDYSGSIRNRYFSIRKFIRLVSCIGCFINHTY